MTWRRWWPRRVAEAEERAAEAERKLAETHRRDGEIRDVVERLAWVRRRNQFGPMIEEAFRRRR